MEEFDAEGEREARVFTLWLNSLDVEPGVYNLFEDLKVRSFLYHLSSGSRKRVCVLTRLSLPFGCCHLSGRLGHPSSV